MLTTKDHKIILKCIGSGAKKVIKEIVGLGKGAPMITASNQACFAKMPGCGLQEGSGGKVGCRFHLSSIRHAVWSKISVRNHHVDET